jgi:hypothetical protein
MFNAHPELAFPPETHFLKRHVVPELSGKERKLSSEELTRDLKENKDLERLGWDLAEWAKKEMEGGGARMHKLYGRMLEAWAEEQGASRPGDKDPMLVEYVPHLSHCFPDAYLVHIIRDPRDVTLSRIRSGWGKGRPLLAHLCEHRTLYRKIRKEGPAYFGEHYVELRYEDLLQEPEGTLKALCEKLPLAYDPAMLEYEGAAQEIVQEDEGDWKRNVLGPLLEKNLEKWKGEMPRGKLRTTESCLKGVIEDAGYSMSGAYSSWSAFWNATPLFLCGLMYRLKFYRQRVRGHG